ncbi:MULTISPECIES: PAS domain S-box protein [Zoogloea]|jgi:PAS domain S-box-containing protein|uniref:PAS domain S-box protein n=1 Tax=Zoogloea TaxID=349 RepID=UPI0025863001|nr:MULTISPECIES: PAS domain S-box protein [Zoogloea]MDD2667092.1 PAS domain S-box protein [Zoogloea sp.]MDY0034541.1 PAS domain S-box protein [Zoogloea oleivorans]
MIFKPGHEPVVPAVDLPPACAPGRRATMLAGIYAAVTALLIMTTQAMLQGWPVLLVIAISSFVLFLVMRRELLGAAGNATAGQATAATSSHNNTCFTEALEKVPHVLYRFNPAHECYDYISAKAGEWLGTPIDVLCAPGGWQHFAHRTPAEDLGRVWAAIEEALRRPGHAPVEISVEYRLDPANGEPMWIHDAMTLLRNPDGGLNAIIGAASDQTAQRATSEYLGVTLRSIGDAVIATDRHSRITLMNPVAEKLTGWTENEAIGQPLDMIFRIINEETGEPVENPADKLMQGSEMARLGQHTLLVDRHGIRRPIANSGAPIMMAPHQNPLGVVLVFHDQSQERLTGQAIVDQQARYRALVENSPVGIFHFTNDLQISYCNGRLAEILHSTAGHLNGLDLHSLGDDAILAMLRGALNGQRGAYDGPFVSPLSTNVQILSIRVAPEYDASGKVYGGVGIVEDRTAFLEAEEQLRDTKERYVLAQRGTNEGLWDWDPKTRHLYLSARLLSLLGLHSDTLRTTGDEWLKLIHPDDRARYRTDFIAHLRGETEHFESEYRIADKDGKFHWVLARGLAHRNQQGRAVRIVGSIGDITARKLAEEQLKAERDFSRGLIDSLPAPFFLFDQRGRLVLWNRFVSELTGLEDAELQDAEAESLVIPEQEPVIAHRIESALLSGETSVEVMLRRNDKEPVPFLVVGRRVILDGRPHIVGVGTDLTERKFAERAIKRLNSELERRVAERTSQLSAALNELESFSYSVSHDLRAPLRAIEGYSSILGSDYGDKLDDEAKELLRRVRAAVHRMGQLIDDLLTLSRVSRKELERRPVDLSHLAQVICEELRQQEPEREMRVDIAPDLRVEGDPSLIRTVLENLLGNAWKFTGRMAQAEIHFSATHHEGVDAFVIRDNGAGFDMRYRENLFRPFQRLHSDREFPGTGIGLATVARIVRRHAGEVWAEGEVGKGAALYFSIGQSQALQNGN